MELFKPETADELEKALSKEFGLVHVCYESCCLHVGAHFIALQEQAYYPEPAEETLKFFVENGGAFLPMPKEILTYDY